MRRTSEPGRADGEREGTGGGGGGGGQFGEGEELGIGQRAGGGAQSGAGRTQLRQRDTEPDASGSGAASGVSGSASAIEVEQAQESPGRGRVRRTEAGTGTGTGAGPGPGWLSGSQSQTATTARTGMAPGETGRVGQLSSLLSLSLSPRAPTPTPTPTPLSDHLPLLLPPAPPLPLPLPHSLPHSLPLPASLSLSPPLPPPSPPSALLDALPRSPCRPHPTPDRPAKRARCSPDMQGPVSNGTLFPPSASPSASKPPLSDDDMSDPEPPRPHLSPLSPRPRPSLAARSPDARPAALHPLQKLDGLLKSFADGLHSLEPLLRAAPDPALPGPSHAPAHPQNLPWPGISDIEREELVRLLLQSLNEIGYPAAAMTLQVESGFSLDPSPEITAFRQNVLAGNWRDVEALLKRELVDCCRHRARADVGHVLGRPRPPAASANGHDPADHSVWVARSLFGVEAHVLNMARFLVAQEKFLELLEARRLKKALVVLRNQIAPLVTPLEPAPAAELAQKPRSPVSTIGSSLNKLSVAAPDGLPRTHAQPAWAPDEEDDPGVQRLCLLSSLMMCGSAEEVREKADWEGVLGGSRTRLLGELQELIPPQKLLPHQRLPYLLEQAKTLQRLQCLYHMSNPRISLLATHSCSRAGFPSETSHVLTRHADEVWRIEWAHDGRRLASADRAKTCIIWRLTATGEGEGARGREGSMYEEQEFAVDFVLDSHPAGIGCIAWSPDDSVLLTGADCTITMWNTRTGDCIATLVKHSYDVSALCWLPDGKSFVSGGMDTEVMFWDLEGRNTFKWQVGPTRVVDLAVSPDGKRIVAIGKASVPSETGTASRAGTANGVGGESEGERAEHRSGSSSNHSEGHGQAAGMEAEVQHRIHVFNVAEKREVGMVVHSRELTCVSVSEDSKYALINHAPNEVLLYALEDQSLIRRFIGQKQGTFIIRSCFGGGSELGVEQRSSFVLSGSEDGKVYVWHLESGALIEALEGHDGGSVNAVAWNEKRGDMFASAGDDHTVRIWQAPVVVQRSLMDTMIATTRRTTSTILNSATRNSVSSSSSSSSTLNLATGTGGPEATVRGTRSRRSLSPTGRKGQQGVQNGF